MRGARRTPPTYAENVFNSVGGVRLSPWEGTNVVDPYFSSVDGTVTYTFATLLDTLKIVWGSPDSYNSLKFYNGATEVATVDENTVR